MHPQFARRDLTCLVEAWNQQVLAGFASESLCLLAALDSDAQVYFYDGDVTLASGCELLDPWGNPYWVEVSADGSKKIVSCGPDLQESTEDDLWAELEKAPTQDPVADQLK